MTALNVSAPNALTRVTDHVEDIIAFVQRIIDNGLAYVTQDGEAFMCQSQAFILCVLTMQVCAKKVCILWEWEGFVCGIILICLCHIYIWACVKTCSDNVGHACEKSNWGYPFENLTKYSPPFQQYSPSLRKIILSTQIKKLLNEDVLPKCNGCNTRHSLSLLCKTKKHSDTASFLTIFVFMH